MKSQVWKHKFKNHNLIKNQLLDMIEKSNPGQVNDNIDKITHTDFYTDIDVKNKNYLKLMYENADDLLDEIAKKYYVGELDITGGWFQQYYKSDTHNWHFHGNSNLSCVYYIELNDYKDSTIFYDIENNNEFQLDVKEGDVVIFPSHTIHKSPILKSDNRKTIISLNISFKKVDTTYMNIDK